MTSPGTKPAPLTPDKVREVILEALGDEGSYREMFSLHLLDYPQRKLDFNDVLFGLKREWEACRIDGFNEREWQWKYEIKTQDIDGRSFFIVLALDPINKKFRIITRYPDD